MPGSTAKNIQDVNYVFFFLKYCCGGVFFFQLSSKLDFSLCKYEVFKQSTFC